MWEVVGLNGLVDGADCPCMEKENSQCSQNLILVLLAAGDSKRFLGNKLLHLFDGKPMYQYVTEQIEKLPANLFSKKVVVTQYPEIMKDLHEKGYVVVENYQAELGISHSIKLALEVLKDCPGTVCFSVCDQPYLRSVTIETLIRQWQKSGKGLGCLSHGDKLGNPAIFSGKYRKELQKLEGDTGGKAVIRHHLEDLFLYEVEEEKELRDIDTK